MYKISFYVPREQVDFVKEAIFKAGAGKIGHYDHCAWQILGEGQFMPLAGSDAFIGEKNNLEKIPEWKVEMVCADELIHAAVEALKKAHPYETPAYQVIKVENF